MYDLIKIIWLKIYAHIHNYTCIYYLLVYHNFYSLQYFLILIFLFYRLDDKINYNCLCFEYNINMVDSNNQEKYKNYLLQLSP